ncbi:unnamed protein product [Anisakis simplex]|uniref:Tripartite motif-containing protein 2 n=1 Tax=Anisakis simplex TaxID=6269 RepID=A0A0M3K047_ANISI|nr:unnamed protein product [Anisakis simplex]
MKDKNKAKPGFFRGTTPKTTAPLSTRGQNLTAVKLRASDNFIDDGKMKLNDHLFNGNKDNGIIDEKGSELVKFNQLELLRQIKFSEQYKIIGLNLHRKRLYVGTSDGHVRIIDPKKYGKSRFFKADFQTDEINFGTNVDRMAVLQNGLLVSQNAQQISVLNSSKQYFHASVPFKGKAIATNDTDVCFLIYH